jgi:RND family efflux transporter MFP subunit
MKRPLKYTLFIPLLTILLVMQACTDISESEQARTENKKIQTVEVVYPQQRTFIAEILITGTAMPNQKVMLYPMEQGFVKNMRKDIGDPVRKGEVITVLENPELVQQKIRLSARLKSKKAIFERLQAVHKKSPALTPLQEVEEAEAEYLSVKAELQATEDRLGFLSVKAPFAGIITRRFVDEGALLQSGLRHTQPQAIVEIQEVNPIRLTIPVPGSDASAIRKGAEAKITFPELPGETFSATISRTAKSLDPSSSTMQVEIDIENPDYKILSGMYAKALMQISSRDQTLSLPIIARARHQNEPFLLIVKEGKVERVPLRIGLTDKDYFEVLNTEITRETQVIIKGKSLVKPGQIVESILKDKKS